MPGRRSQHSNKAKALHEGAAGAHPGEGTQRARRQEAAERKAWSAAATAATASGPTTSRRGRLTDHRINLTLYKLLQVMEGDLDEVLHALQLARRRADGRARGQRSGPWHAGLSRTAHDHPDDRRSRV